jgi:hypothetical protein
LRLLRRHRRVTPLIDLRLFRVRSFSGAASELLLSLVLVVRGAGLTTANLALMVMLPRRAVAREQSRRASRAAGPEAPGG